MHTRREFLAAGLAGVAALAADPPRPFALGVLLYSFGIHACSERGFAEPGKFLACCKERGAAGVQMPLGTRTAEQGASVRKAAERLGMFVEGIVRLPGAERMDAERFAAELATARACGAEVVRTVLLS